MLRNNSKFVDTLCKSLEDIIQYHTILLIYRLNAYIVFIHIVPFYPFILHLSPCVLSNIKIMVPAKAYDESMRSTRGDKYLKIIGRVCHGDVSEHLKIFETLDP